MEKSSIGGAATEKDGGDSIPESKAQKKLSSSPRSKLEDTKGLQPSSSERRYKEMLYTTSHIYQHQAASGVSDTSEEASVSSRSAQTHSKEVTLPVAGVEKAHPAADVLPEEITAEVPVAEMVCRDLPASSAVINAENDPAVRHSEGKTTVASHEENATEDCLRHIPTENSLVDHEDNSTTGATTSCNRHSSAHAESKLKPLISRPKLCESCTVSMLSYIAVLRDMLDEVTSEITNQDTQSVQCVECFKEKVIQRSQTRTSAHAEHASGSGLSQRPQDLPFTKQSRKITQSTAGNLAPLAQEASAIDDTQRSYQQTATSIDRQQLSAANGVDPTQPVSRAGSAEPAAKGTEDGQSPEHVSPNQSSAVRSENQVSLEIANERRTHTNSDIPATQRHTTNLTDVFGERRRPLRRSTGDLRQLGETQLPLKYHEGSESLVLDHSETPTYLSDRNDISEVAYTESRQVPASHRAAAAASDQLSWQKSEPATDRRHDTSNGSSREDYDSQTSPLFGGDREGSDGILSTLSNEEREVYDSARGRAGWEQLMDTQDYRDTSFGPEAFVTMATTNAEAIGCLVLGSSLSLCRTTRTLCVLITDGVNPSLRAPLASVFQVVQSVRSLDTVGTTKVSLLDQPELGIFFRKLHVWRLVQFSKCVFLNPDTLVIQNCDELFCHEELSAVTDIGWPDCFNSGVFVFQPSTETFWKLVEFADSEGSYDGGDQGLLNAFFKSWSKDIHKKLSFMYNLMANVSYTYTPAFKQFGRNVKIVQFQGAYKPWHVKFYTRTSQIAPSTTVHPTYVQFVHVWLTIFRVRVLPLLSQDVQSFASSQNVISAFELLKFYPSPIEVEADFLLTPPSVRVRPDSLRFPKQPSIIRRHSIGTAKELTRDEQPFEFESTEEQTSQEGAPSEKNMGDPIPTEDYNSRVAEEVAPSLAVKEESSAAAEELFSPSPEEVREVQESFEDAGDDESLRSSIPGSEIGDYQGMAAWEQGRMDYMGSACSENIIKRLHFLMDKPSDSEKQE